MIELVARAFAVAHATPAPVIELVARAFAVAHATPAPVIEHGPRPPAAGTSARAVVHEATATVIECVDPARTSMWLVPSGHLQRPLQSCA